MAVPWQDSIFALTGKIPETRIKYQFSAGIKITNIFIIRAVLGGTGVDRIFLYAASPWRVCDPCIQGESLDVPVPVDSKKKSSGFL